MPSGETERWFLADLKICLFLPGMNVEFRAVSAPPFGAFPAGWSCSVFGVWTGSLRGMLSMPNLHELIVEADNVPTMSVGTNH